MPPRLQAFSSAFPLPGPAFLHSLRCTEKCTSPKQGMPSSHSLPLPCAPVAQKEVERQDVGLGTAVGQAIFGALCLWRGATDDTGSRL